MPFSPLLRWRPTVRSDMLALLASLFFSLSCNVPFWSALLAGRDASAFDTWWLAIAGFVLVTALHTFLLLLVLNRWSAKPLLALLAITLGPSVYFMAHFPVYMDPAMLRNVLGTDAHETRELLSLSMIPWLAGYTLLPLLLLWRIRVRREDPVWLAMRRRVLMLLLSLVAIVASAWLAMDTLVPTMREHKEMRYLITPSNYLYSLARVASHETRAARKPRTIVGADAHRAAQTAGRKPVVVILVLGETVRAANWGLSGYARQTTPELAKRNVLNFTHVTSCGTNTEVSVPCMFSSQGRRHYDEDAIRNSESLLHVVDHAGIQVLWRDNQSGCKGVCDGLAGENLFASHNPLYCGDGRCLDEILLDGIGERLAKSPRDLFIVLHAMGNHGPAYFQRYPEQFRRWTPTCDTTDIGNCPHEALVNTYDNAILYTDHLLAHAIDTLAADSTHDSVLLYLSDHGESLGENHFYLHSLPMAIAPDVQTHVPLTMWLSPGFIHAQGLDPGCLLARAGQPASHDNLFHTVLGLLNVQTAAYEPAMDVATGCRH